MYIFITRIKKSAVFLRRAGAFWVLTALLPFIVSCAPAKTVPDAVNEITTETVPETESVTEAEPEKIWVYDTTDQYIPFRAMSLLLEYTKKHTQSHGFLYEQPLLSYEIEDIRVEGILNNERNCTEFVIYQNDEKLVDSVYISVEGDVTVVYADVTHNGCKEVVIISTPGRGTGPQEDKIYIFDTENKNPVELFRQRYYESSLTDSYLTEQQKEEAAALWDDKFYETFSELSEITLAGGRIYVSESGEIYYETAIYDGEHFTGLGSFGRMILFFSYDREDEALHVVDYIYMPYYIDSNSADGGTE